MKKKGKKTDFKDMHGKPIFEGDILVGKTDREHPMSIGALYERGHVHRHPMANNPIIEGSTDGWFWHGHKLDSVAKNVVKIGSIFETPEKLLFR